MTSVWLPILVFLVATSACVADEAASQGDCGVRDVMFLQTALQTEVQVEPTTTKPVTIDAAGVSGVTGNEAGDLSVFLSAVVMNSCIVLFFMAVTSILRSLYPLMMTNNSLTGRVRDNPATDWTSWCWASLEKSRDAHVEYCGLDHAMLLEYTVFCMRLLAFIGVPVFCITAPLNFFFGHGQAETDGDNLSMIGINNVRSGHPYMYKVYGVLTLYVVFMAHREIHKSMRTFCGYRSTWLRELREPQASTVMVEGIPEEYRSEDKVREFFSQMFSEDVVKDVNIVKYIPDLESVCADLQSAKQGLAKAQAEWENAGKKADARPKIAASMMGGSTDLDAIDHYTAHVKSLETQVKTYQVNIESEAKAGVGGVNGHTAFVSFSSRKEARVSLSMQFTADRDEWVITQPSEPETLIWSDLKVSDEKKAGKRLIGYALVAGLYMVFTPFCIWVTNIAESINLGPLQSVWATYAPTLGLLIFLSFAPTILINIFAVLFNYKTEVRVQEQLQIWYFWFMFFFTILVTVVGQNFEKFFEDVMKDPLQFPLLLADKMPAATHYYLNFLCTQWFTHGMNLTRYVSIGKFVGFRKLYTDEEARAMSEPEDQDYYGMGSRSARFTTNMLIAIIFGTISPLISFIAWVNFFVCRLFYGYLFVYAETKKADGGGVFFVSQMQHTYFGLVIYIFLKIGIFSSRAPTWFPISCAIAALVFVLWSWRKFNNLEWEVLPWQDMVMGKDGKDHAREDTGKKYIQPELLAEEK